MIAIIDYQAGNLRSVELAFARVGARAVITGDPAVIAAADGAVLVRFKTDAEGNIHMAADTVEK